MANYQALYEHEIEVTGLISEESEATKKAHEMGLVYLGYAKWAKNQNGDAVAKSVNGGKDLVDINTGQPYTADSAKPDGFDATSEPGEQPIIQDPTVVDPAMVSMDPISTIGASKQAFDKLKGVFGDFMNLDLTGKDMWTYPLISNAIMGTGDWEKNADALIKQFNTINKDAPLNPDDAKHFFLWLNKKSKDGTNPYVNSLKTSITKWLGQYSAKPAAVAPEQPKTHAVGPNGMYIKQPPAYDPSKFTPIEEPSTDGEEKSGEQFSPEQRSEIFDKAYELIGINTTFANQESGSGLIKTYEKYFNKALDADGVYKINYAVWALMNKKLVDKEQYEKLRKYFYKVKNAKSLPGAVNKKEKKPENPETGALSGGSYGGSIHNVEPEKLHPDVFAEPKSAKKPKEKPIKPPKDVASGPLKKMIEKMGAKKYKGTSYDDHGEPVTDEDINHLKGFISLILKSADAKYKGMPLANKPGAVWSAVNNAISKTAYEADPNSYTHHTIPGGKVTYGPDFPKPPKFSYHAAKKIANWAKLLAKKGIILAPDGSVDWKSMGLSEPAQTVSKASKLTATADPDANDPDLEADPEWAAKKAALKKGDKFGVQSRMKSVPAEKKTADIWNTAMLATTPTHPEEQVVKVPYIHKSELSEPQHHQKWNSSEDHLESKNQMTWRLQNWSIPKIKHVFKAQANWQNKSIFGSSALIRKEAYAAMTLAIDGPPPARLKVTDGGFIERGMSVNVPEVKHFLEAFKVGEPAYLGPSGFSTSPGGGRQWCNPASGHAGVILRIRPRKDGTIGALSLNHWQNASSNFMGTNPEKAQALSKAGIQYPSNYDTEYEVVAGASKNTRVNYIKKWTDGSSVLYEIDMTEMEDEDTNGGDKPMGEAKETNVPEKNTTGLKKEFYKGLSKETVKALIKYVDTPLGFGEKEDKNDKT